MGPLKLSGARGGHVATVSNVWGCRSRPDISAAETSDDEHLLCSACLTGVGRSDTYEGILLLGTHETTSVQSVSLASVHWQVSLSPRALY